MCHRFRHPVWSITEILEFFADLFRSASDALPFLPMSVAVNREHPQVVKSMLTKSVKKGAHKRRESLAMFQQLKTEGWDYSLCWFWLRVYVCVCSYQRVTPVFETLDEVSLDALELSSFGSPLVGSIGAVLQPTPSVTLPVCSLA
jgi:hypothetical protein